jgi:antitoxin component YwqK of YwqJK toxin-antitoxin module
VTLTLTSLHDATVSSHESLATIHTMTDYKRYILFLNLYFIFSICFSQKNDSIINMIDTNNLKQGTWREYWNDYDDWTYTDDIKGYSIGNYHDNEKEGCLIYYYNNGKIFKKFNYSKNAPLSVVFIDKKEKIIYADTLINGNGCLYDYYSNGKLKRYCYYKNGARTGIEIWFSEHGNVEGIITSGNDSLYNEFTFKNKKKFNSLTFSYKSRNAKRIYADAHFNKGKLMSDFSNCGDNIYKEISFYSNGYIRDIKMYKFINKKTYYFGTWKSFDNNGQLKKETIYFDLSGAKTREYKDGILIKEQYFDESNEQIKNYDDW